eukprot:TRINITY_DN19059_c0_g2_i1.p1 TRINITY_DN19059_c0_g2~~TRINITY_DN19059_c0_g2_i1.p1  ORF type:complete len:626 (-),score=93.83 TRINITY_DN19059_c0_g2_i1:805-2682(-)
MDINRAFMASAAADFVSSSTSFSPFSFSGRRTLLDRIIHSATEGNDGRVSGGDSAIFSSPLAILIAFICTCIAVAVSIGQILEHLNNYTEPTFQRYTVRIIFMVPVYATMSFLALVFSDLAIWFNTIRDVYEAWVIYNFLSLCLAWVGGPGAVVTSLHGRLLKPSYFLFTCCFPAIPLDGMFIRHCKQGCLQFVILKPLLAATSLILYSYGKYEDGNFSPVEGYLYITIVYMVSYSLAIYALILFYLACKDLLKPFQPIPKFIVIKSVVFLTYWQGVLVFLISKTGIVHSDEDAADLQNLLICAEMALAAMGFLLAFPHKAYMQANVGENAGWAGNITHAINFKDVINDTVHQFAPTYHDYILYSDGTQEAPRKYRARTFVPTGHEMDALRKNGRKPGSSRAADPSLAVDANSALSSPNGIEPSEISSEASSQDLVLSPIDDMKGSLLVDTPSSASISPHSVTTPTSPPGGQVGVGDSGGRAVVGGGVEDDKPLTGARSMFARAFSSAKGRRERAAQSTKPDSLSVLPEEQSNGRGTHGAKGPTSGPPSILQGVFGSKSKEAEERRGSVESSESRRTSGTDAGEETHLTRGRADSSTHGGHGMLLDEIDMVGEDNFNRLEGHTRM